MGKISIVNSKLTASVLLVIGLVVFTNWLNHRYFSKIKNSVDQQYLAQQGLYELYHYFNQKRWSLDSSHASIDTNDNAAIEKLLLDIQEIELPPSKAKQISDIKDHYNTFIELESSEPNGNENQLEMNNLKYLLDQILGTMEESFANMLDEPGKVSQKNRKSWDIGKLLLNVELAFIIILGTIIQLIVISIPKEGNSVKKNHIE